MTPDILLGRTFSMAAGPDFTVVGWDGATYRCRTADGASGELTAEGLRRGLRAGAIRPALFVNTRRGMKVMK